MLNVQIFLIRTRSPSRVGHRGMDDSGGRAPGTQKIRKRAVTVQRLVARGLLDNMFRLELYYCLERSG